MAMEVASVDSSQRIIVPLDVDSAAAAADLVRTLRGHVGAFKVGLELVHAAGFEVFDVLREAGADRVFYDCKLHDIPNTVAGAARAVARLGMWMFNIHAQGGARMIQAARQAVDEATEGNAGSPPLLLGVTLLTSIGARELADELRVDLGPSDYVARLAQMAVEHGCNGVVCSPHEIRAVRDRCGSSSVIVTPGVRPKWAAANDQRRVMTPADAIRAGADYLVIGRPITGAADPAAAARAVGEEIRLAQSDESQSA